MGSFVTFPPKISTSTVPLIVNFSSQLLSGEAVTAVSCTAAVVVGVDPTPGDILHGITTLLQNIVTQRITDGIVGVMYRVDVNATTNFNNLLTISAYIAVVNDDPFVAV